MFSGLNPEESPGTPPRGTSLSDKSKVDHEVLSAPNPEQSPGTPPRNRSLLKAAAPPRESTDTLNLDAKETCA